MTTMLDKVKFSPYERQKYTKYEISNMVKQKREKLGLDVQQFALKFEVEPRVVLDIEDGKRSFNAEMYKICSKILDKSLDELLKKDVDQPLNIMFRKSESKISKEPISYTVELANTLFHEMIIQHKMNI